MFLVLALSVPTHTDGQSVKVRDVTQGAEEVPVRLAGYGLVTGLSGTGDRIYGGDRRSMTVRAIANLMRNMGIEVPEQVIRSRNAAAVLVTAEASPYTRQGGRFDVSVASLGDASSLRGGQLWPTPLSAGVGAPVAAVAQGTIQVGGGDRRSRYDVETSATITRAGVAQLDFGGGSEPPSGVLVLREPDLALAQAIAGAINLDVGSEIATVTDPGAVTVDLPDEDPFGTLVAIGAVEVTPERSPRVVVNALDGLVAAGGEIRVGPAVVSHDWLTLTIASQEVVATPADDAPLPAADPAGGAPAVTGTDVADEGASQVVGVPGAVRLAPGIRVQELAEALHAVGASGQVIGSIFQSLRSVGALQAEVQIR
ncbi:MAG: flagellar basal body P-ring protein FlgI [Longimicrobiales bacterium]|nr:flagellar basal body P-ring protein FlgI [Longimicrobiales bacterium]